MAGPAASPQVAAGDARAAAAKPRQRRQWPAPLDALQTRLGPRAAQRAQAVAGSAAGVQHARTGSQGDGAGQRVQRASRCREDRRVTPGAQRVGPHQQRQRQQPGPGRHRANGAQRQRRQRKAASHEGTPPWTANDQCGRCPGRQPRRPGQARGRPGLRGEREHEPRRRPAQQGRQGPWQTGRRQCGHRRQCARPAPPAKYVSAARVPGCLAHRLEGKKRGGSRGTRRKAQRSVPGGDKSQEVFRPTGPRLERGTVTKCRSFAGLRAPAPGSVQTVSAASRGSAAGRALPASICSAPASLPLPARAGGWHSPQT